VNVRIVTATSTGIAATVTTDNGQSHRVELTTTGSWCSCHRRSCTHLDALNTYLGEGGPDDRPTPTGPAGKGGA
jgi:hypothetical protein